MPSVASGLKTPYPDAGKYTAVELLRATLMREVYPIKKPSYGAAMETTPDDRAARILGWVMQSDLRSVLPYLPAINGTFEDGPNTLELAQTLDASGLPSPIEFQKNIELLDLAPRVVEVLAPWLESSLPHRRVEGYCALACLCAVRHPTAP